LKHRALRTVEYFRRVELNHLEDKEFIEALILQDEDAFNRFFKYYQPLVYSIVHAIVGQSSEIEDLVQEVFLKVLKGIVHFRGESRLSTWIYSIARNHALNHISKKSNRNPTVDIEDEPPIERNDPEKELSAAERAGIVKRSMKKLREEYRVALELKFMGEFSYEEIAEIMNLPVGTVKTYIHRGKEELKESLRKNL